MAELARLLNGLLQSFPVLDMAGVVADSAVEDVLQCVFSKKLITQDTHALRVFEVHPQVTKICDCVYVFLFFR